MDETGKRTQRDYTLAFKRAVADQVEKGELSYKQAQRRYGIQGRSTVLVWLLKHANEKVQLLEAMLDVIRKEYGVKLRKKLSGESSSKSK